MTDRTASARPAALAGDLDRRTLLLAGAAGLAATTFAGVRPAWAAPQVGKPAPDFSATDSNGATRSLSALRGKIVVLEWTNHGCPFVRKHYNSGNMQALQREVTGKDAVWLSIISSPPGEQGHVEAAEANELTTSRKAAPTAVLLDPQGQVARLYGAQVTPHMFIIDAEGTLVYMGGIDSIASTRAEDLAKAQPYVKEAFLAVAAGQPVKTAVTRPYGCVVKYVDA